MATSQADSLIRALDSAKTTIQVPETTVVSNLLELANKYGIANLFAVGLILVIIWMLLKSQSDTKETMTKLALNYETSEKRLDVIDKALARAQTDINQIKQRYTNSMSPESAVTIVKQYIAGMFDSITLIIIDNKDDEFDFSEALSSSIGATRNALGAHKVKHKTLDFFFEADAIKDQVLEYIDKIVQNKISTSEIINTMKYKQQTIFNRMIQSINNHIEEPN